MKIFTAHRPPQISQEEAVFIREGFSWPAFFFPVIWLVLKRLWLPLVLYLLALALVFALAAWLSLSFTFVFLAVLGINLLLGMEGNERRRRAMARRGFIEEGPFVGKDVQEAELRYFHPQHGDRASMDAV